MSQYEDFTLNQGADFSIQLELVDKNQAKKSLSGYTGKGKSVKLTHQVIQMQLRLL